MIVYRSQERTVATTGALARVRESFASVKSRRDHESAQQLLIDFGEFEAGAVDALGDESPDMCAALRTAAVATGHILYLAWKGIGLEESVDRFGAAFSIIGDLEFPPALRISVPEGYAYYSLYPETFITAAEAFTNTKGRGCAVVIGIRSIGASLSAVVAASLEELGWAVTSHTVRPGGHPFDRIVDLPRALAGELRAPRCGFENRSLPVAADKRHFGPARVSNRCSAHPSTAEVLIVDEGPGLSGSSFASVARAVCEAGIAANRISLFPSWNPDGSGFRNSRAAEVWRSHARFTSGFDALKPPPAAGRDISGGAWRPVLIGADEDLWPAVQPQHEAMKFLSDGSLLKFAGLGRYGAEKLELAAILGRERFAPRAIALRNGFLETAFVPGVPILPDRAVPQDLVESAARYLAFRSRTFPRAHSVSFDEIAGMISFNSKQSIGGAPQDSWFREIRAEVENRGATAVDGRMLPHEWLGTPGGYLKADAVDHHAGHFFPGDTDIAWDLAAAVIEFRLGPGERETLLQRYRKLTSDLVTDRVLAFYEIAWLAFRVGYTSLATEAVGSAERSRFARDRRRYEAALEFAVRTSAEIGQVPA